MIDKETKAPGEKAHAHDLWEKVTVYQFYMQMAEAGWRSWIVRSKEGTYSGHNGNLVEQRELENWVQEAYSSFISKNDIGSNTVENVRDL